MERRDLLKNSLAGITFLHFLSPKINFNMTNQTLEEILLQRYHGIRRNIKTAIYDQLAEKDIREMPHGMNSIAWNIWHMARAEDVGMNRLITDGQQVFDQEDFGKKMNTNIRHFGTGMTTEEVRELNKTIDVEALKAYHEKVGEQTLQVFQKLDQIKLDEKIDPNYLNQVMIKEGVLHERALWVEAFYQTKIRAWFLVHMGLTHNFEHLGQIMLIRKLMGFKGTR